MTRIDFGGCPLDLVGRDELVELLAKQIGSRRPHHHVSLNAAKWVAMRHDESLRRAVRAATTVVADGMSVVVTARAPERLPGIEVAEALRDRAATNGWRVVLVGGTAEVVAEVSRRWRERGISVVGAFDGYFDPSLERDVALEIRDLQPDLVLLALGSPKAEHFVLRWGSTMRTPLAMGVGGSFDVWAGRARRAPKVFGDAGLEWAWRLAGSPRQRFRRAALDPATFLLDQLRGARLPA